MYGINLYRVRDARITFVELVDCEDDEVGNLLTLDNG